MDEGHPQNSVSIFSPSVWPLRAAQRIQSAVDAILQCQNECRVMLTGGKSAERLYAAWASLPAFQSAKGLQFFFGDERCVPPDHAESNYGMALRTLFYNGVPEGCTISRMEADDADQEAAALRYQDLLQKRIDVLLLGVGEDGHIASLFPGRPELQERMRQVVQVTGPKPPYRRLTITPSVIEQAQSVFVLAAGEAKAKVLVKAQQDPESVCEFPARLVLRATWLLDSKL